VAPDPNEAAAQARDVIARVRALRQLGAAIALETAEIMDHRALVLEAMGAPEERIRAVREFAGSERRVAAEWGSESEPTAD
jgi:hypothetical protein